MANVIPDKSSFKKLLESGKKLNVYLGIDPTATQIHIGHAVPLRKLQAFSELGHNVTFLIGNFTALIGDTSDKDSERPILTKEEIQKNFETYQRQAEKIVDFSNITVKKNSDWLSKLTFEDIVKLAQNFSVGEFVGRELIKNRLQEGKPVRLDETLYPVMQGYDSFYMDTDIQIGGADQTFNMQAGRTLQKNLRSKQSYVLVTDYLTGTDGRKMSKSWGNAIWLSDEPREMFGKVMSINDELVEEYFVLATNTPVDEISKILSDYKDDPMTAKKILAHRLVSELYSEKFADGAKEHFEKTFQEGEPEFAEEIALKNNLLDTISQVLKSRSQAKRLIMQGAVDLNADVTKDPSSKVKSGDKIKIRKKQFIKLI